MRRSRLFLALPVAICGCWTEGRSVGIVYGEAEKYVPGRCEAEARAKDISGEPKYYGFECTFKVLGLTVSHTRFTSGQTDEEIQTAIAREHSDSCMDRNGGDMEKCDSIDRAQPFCASHPEDSYCLALYSGDTTGARVLLERSEGYADSVSRLTPPDPQ